MAIIVPSTERISSGLVPSSEPTHEGSGLVPSTAPVPAEPAGLVPSTERVLDAPVQVAPSVPVPAQRDRAAAGEVDVRPQAPLLDGDAADWPPLGRQSDGTFVWQYGPQWLKTLWGVEN